MRRHSTNARRHTGTCVSGDLLSVRHCAVPLGHVPTRAVICLSLVIFGADLLAEAVTPVWLVAVCVVWGKPVVRASVQPFKRRASGCDKLIFTVHWSCGVLSVFRLRFVAFFRFRCRKWICDWKNSSFRPTCRHWFTTVDYGNIPFPCLLMINTYAFCFGGFLVNRTNAISISCKHVVQCTTSNTRRQEKVLNKNGKLTNNRVVIPLKCNRKNFD